jgi:ATP-dependent DNA helicase 2 subunit 1
MLNTIVSSDRDTIGVILFGTNKTSNVLNVPHVSVLQDLQQPNADKIKQLETMLKRKFLCSFRYQHTETSFEKEVDVVCSDHLT